MTSEVRNTSHVTADLWTMNDYGRESKEIPPQKQNTDISIPKSYPENLIQETLL